MTLCPLILVLAQALSMDGEAVTKEALQEMIAACDIDASTVNMDTLFPQVLAHTASSVVCTPLG